MMLVLSLIAAVTVQASPSATIMPSGSVLAETSQIRQLKDKLATKVAEIRKKSGPISAGEVVTIAQDTITIKDRAGKEQKVLLDDTVTKYYRVAATEPEELKVTDVKKGNYIIASGLAQDKGLSANEIYVDVPYAATSGVIQEVDADNFTVKIETPEKETVIVDIEQSTKQNIIDPTDATITVSGFSKLKEGDIAHVTYKYDSTAKGDRITASTITVINTASN